MPDERDDEVGNALHMVEVVAPLSAHSGLFLRESVPLVVRLEMYEARKRVALCDILDLDELIRHQVREPRELHTLLIQQS